LILVKFTQFNFQLYKLYKLYKLLTKNMAYTDKELYYQDLEKKKQRAVLYKNLYNAARCCIDPQFRTDPSAVRCKRDYVVWDLFEKPYDELTDSQLVDCINEMQVQSGYAEPNTVLTLATPKQRKLLRFYAVSCAFIYADFSELQHVDDESGEILDGEYLRAYLRKRFEEKRGFLPNNIHRFLYESWINPHSHKFMVEGGFKKYYKEEKYFHYEYLKSAECNYLIKRYERIYQKCAPLTDMKDIINELSTN
jgi:hypothetical protein